MMDSTLIKRKYARFQKKPHEFVLPVTVFDLLWYYLVSREIIASMPVQKGTNSAQTFVCCRKRIVYSFHGWRDYCYLVCCLSRTRVMFNEHYTIRLSIYEGKSANIIVLAYNKRNMRINFIDFT